MVVAVIPACKTCYPSIYTGKSQKSPNTVHLSVPQRTLIFLLWYKRIYELPFIICRVCYERGVWDSPVIPTEKTPTTAHSPMLSRVQALLSYCSQSLVGVTIRTLKIPLGILVPNQSDSRLLQTTDKTVTVNTWSYTYVLRQGLAAYLLK